MPETAVRPSEVRVLVFLPVRVDTRAFAVLVTGLAEFRIEERVVRIFILSREPERTDICRGVPT